MNKSSAITCAPSSNHFAWLDWMKVLALFSVIWGHFFSLGYQYHYVFNVQAFCVVSGFLYRQAPDWRSCLEKNIRQLLVPTVVLSLLMQLEAVVRCWLMGTTARSMVSGVPTVKVSVSALSVEFHSMQGSGWVRMRVLSDGPLTESHREAMDTL